MSTRYYRHLRIISGGQTGVDRAALDFALEHGIEHGGWCPRGRIAEDGVIDNRYHLQETESSVYPERTYRNIIDSDGTLIFSDKAPLTRGTRLTAELAKREYKPLLVVFSELSVHEACCRLRDFLAGQSVRTVNVAGPRANSRNAGLMLYVREVLDALVRLEHSAEGA